VAPSTEKVTSPLERVVGKRTGRIDRVRGVQDQVTLEPFNVLLDDAFPDYGPSPMNAVLTLMSQIRISPRVPGCGASSGNRKTVLRQSVMRVDRSRRLPARTEWAQRSRLEFHR